MDCDGSGQTGMALALNHRLEKMCALKDAALDWTGPEGVHKMRVASRRLRAALQDFMPYLGKRRTSSCLKQIKEIAQALGRVRDHDVAIIKLERTAAEAPAGVAAGIRRFAQLRDHDRQNARAQLTALLGGESLPELTTKFKAMLEAGRVRPVRSSKEKILAATAHTYREVGSAIVLTRLKEVEVLSKNLYRPLKTKPLHKTRIGVKHLRYALQLFEQCWGMPVAVIEEKVADLQTSLGKLHDCDVWIKDLSEMANSDVWKPDFDDRATVVWLLCYFVKARGKYLNAALMQWQEWEIKGFSSHLLESIQVLRLESE